MAANQRTQTTTPAPAPQPQTGALQTQGEQKPNMSERFTSKVMMEFGSSVGAIQVTDYQRQLIRGYFVAIDRALKAAEEERLRKNANNRDHEKYDNPLPLGEREPERSGAGCCSLRPHGAGHDAEEPPVRHPLQEQQDAEV